MASEMEINYEQVLAALDQLTVEELAGVVDRASTLLKKAIAKGVPSKKKVGVIPSQLEQNHEWVSYVLADARINGWPSFVMRTSKTDKSTGDKITEEILMRESVERDDEVNVFADTGKEMSQGQAMCYAKALKDLNDEIYQTFMQNYTASVGTKKVVKKVVTKTSEDKEREKAEKAAKDAEEKKRKEEEKAAAAAAKAAEKKKKEEEKAAAAAAKAKPVTKEKLRSVGILVPVKRERPSSSAPAVAAVAAVAAPVEAPVEVEEEAPMPALEPLPTPVAVEEEAPMPELEPLPTPAPLPAPAPAPTPAPALQKKELKKRAIPAKAARPEVDPFVTIDGALKQWEWNGKVYARDGENYVWAWNEEEDDTGAFQGRYNYKLDKMEECEEPEFGDEEELDA